MTGHDLFLGMDEIDVKFVEEASTVTAFRHKRHVVKYIILAALLSLLGLVAFAAEINVPSEYWFFSFFAQEADENTYDVLSDNQQEILDTGLISINESITNQGYTITLESGICDGYRMLVKLRIDAPAGVVLDERNCMLYFESDIMPPNGTDGNYSAASYIVHSLEDEDPNDNSAIKLIDWVVMPPDASDYSIANGTSWTIRFHKIEVGKFINDTYEPTVLCEGAWDFDVTFENELLITNSVELLAEPIRCDSTMLINNRIIHNKQLDLKAKVFSFELRSLTAIIRYERPILAKFSGVDLDDPIYLVLKDGNRINLKCNQTIYRGSYDESIYVFDRPVSADDILSIHLPGADAVYVAEDAK